MEIQKLTKTSRAPQAKAAKELAEVRSRLQYDIEENGDSENSTLSKLAAAFCRDDKSKEKLQKYEQKRRSKFEQKRGEVMPTSSCAANQSQKFVLCSKCGLGKAFREGWRCLNCAKDLQRCGSCGDVKSFPGQICDECYTQLKRYENLGV